MKNHLGFGVQLSDRVHTQYGQGPGLDPQQCKNKSTNNFFKLKKTNPLRSLHIC